MGYTRIGVREFKCLNDCRIEGCPGHRMELLFQRSVDVWVIDIDGERTYMDDHAIEVLVDIYQKGEEE